MRVRKRTFNKFMRKHVTTTTYMAVAGVVSLFAIAKGDEAWPTVPLMVVGMIWGLYIDWTHWEDV